MPTCAQVLVGLLSFKRSCQGLRSPPPPSSSQISPPPHPVQRQTKVLTSLAQIKTVAVDAAPSEAPPVGFDSTTVKDSSGSLTVSSMSPRMMFCDHRN